MIIPESTYTALLCLRRYALPEIVNWENAFDYLHRQRISNETMKHFLKFAPDDYRSKYEVTQNTLKQRINAMITAINELTASSEKNGLIFCLIKGLSFSHYIYNDPFERYFSDIDILIRDEDAPQMDVLLRSLGYKQYARNSDGTQIELPFPILKSANHHEYYEYQKTIDETPVTVEIGRWFHVNITDCTNEFLKSRILISENGICFPALDKEHCFVNLLENAWHNAMGIRSNYFPFIAKLKDIEDIHFFLENNSLDSQALERVLMRCHFQSQAKQILDIENEIYKNSLQETGNSYTLACCSPLTRRFLQKTIEIDSFRLSHMKQEYNRLLRNASKAKAEKLSVKIDERDYVSLTLQNNLTCVLPDLIEIPDKIRIKIRLIWNESNIYSLYLWKRNDSIVYACIHGTKHFFDDYYDRSVELQTNKVSSLQLNHGIARIRLESPLTEAFQSGLHPCVARTTIQKQIYETIYHDIAQGQDLMVWTDGSMCIVITSISNGDCIKLQEGGIDG